MNIAFTTVLIFILLAPGFIYRIAYNSTKLSVRNPNKNILNDLAWAIIPSLTIHIITISIIEWITKYHIDFELLGNLILGVTDDHQVEESFGQLRAYLYPIFFYNLIVFSFSFTVGYAFNKLIREFKWDRKYRYLRFTNKWHYIFTGECLDFEDVPDNFEEITDKIINVLCKVNGKSILYTGEYFNYYIDSNGDLEAIHLKYPIRRYLGDDAKPSDKVYYEISSRYLVIPNSDIININFRYLKKEEVKFDDLTDEEKAQVIFEEEVPTEDNEKEAVTQVENPKKKKAVVKNPASKKPKN